MIKNFVELETLLIRNKIKPRKLVLVNAHEEASLLSVVEIMKRGYIEPTLIGNEPQILAILEAHKIRDVLKIIHADSDKEAAFKAVECVRDGDADILMKGFIQTSDLLREVVNRDTGIRNQPVLSHVALIEIPYLERMFMITDGGMIPYPNFEQKIGIIENAVHVAHALGVAVPKVALIDAAEHTNPHIQASLDSEKISQKTWKDATVEGPISIDLAVSSTIATTKKYAGKIQGDANILVVPDIISGNILGKVGTLFTEGKMAGIVQGAKVPIVLTSRGSTLDEKINSILLSCFIGNEES